MQRQDPTCDRLRNALLLKTEDREGGRSQVVREGIAFLNKRNANAR